MVNGFDRWLVDRWSVVGWLVGRWSVVGGGLFEGNPVNSPHIDVSTYPKNDSLCGLSYQSCLRERLGS